MKADPARKELRDLVKTVELALQMIDREMKQPSSVEQGQRIATICNGLELQKDIAKRYGLPRKR